MNAIPWLKTRSDGSASLSHHLTVAIFDYQRAFGHEPRMIRVPYFRADEIDNSLLVFRNGRAYFRGVEFKFSIIIENIELCGSI